MDGYLTRLGSEQLAGDPDVIVEVEELDDLVGIGKIVRSEIDLDPARDVFQVSFDGFPLPS